MRSEIEYRRVLGRGGRPRATGLTAPEPSMLQPVDFRSLSSTVTKQMKPFPVITTCLLTISSGVAVAQSIDTPPSTPGDPTARAYGPTSGGVAWQRSSDDRIVRGYEITRDGTVIGVRDTLSYVADDLRPGRGYNFAIVAIDSAGQRSGRAIARIETPDARPNRPTGLSANVYSATAAGIRWDRSGVFGERYEVKRDGEIVAAATNGTSYVDTNLSGRRPYLFEVIAVNRQGQRSPAARLFVRTTDGSSPPPVAGPPAPDGLRSVVYSATAGAVSWSRASTPGLRYEVRRDGELVSTTNGTSYVDDTLSAGTSYEYEVTALDGSRRSGASTVTLSTPGTRPTSPPEPSASTIGVENREEVLAEVLAVIAGEVYRSAFSLVDEVLLGEGGTTLLSEETGPNGESVRRFECEGGGVFENTSSGTSQSVSNDIVVAGCRIEGVAFDGTVRSESDASAGGSTELVTDLEITEADGGVIVLASEREEQTLTLFDSRRIGVERYEASGPDGAVSIEEAVSAVSDSRPADGAPALGATFTARVSAPWTDGEPLEIRTEEPFAIGVPPGIGSDEESYVSGVLVAEAADGSLLRLEADNGDVGSYTVTIEAQGGVSAFTVPVSEETSIPCLVGTGDEGEGPACELDLGNRF